MNKSPLEILREGCGVLDAVMNSHGFFLKEGRAAKGSGGPYAKGEYVSGERKLEIHYRFSLGLVTYHFGELQIGHESYMRGLLGAKGGNRYPGFSEDPLDGFSGLAYDLENFAIGFLKGNFEEFRRCAELAEERKKIPGFARLP